MPSETFWLISGRGETSGKLGVDREISSSSSVMCDRNVRNNGVVR